jgi:hypothetical protein
MEWTELIVILFIVIVIIYVFFNSLLGCSSCRKIEGFENEDKQIQFLTNDEIMKMMDEDKDGYFQSFSPYDYMARGVQDKESYLKKIQEGLYELDHDDKEKIRQTFYQIFQRLPKIKLSYFDGEKASLLPIKIGVIKDRKYEGGLPHTRGDNIIMMGNQTIQKDKDNFKKTMVHELVHLYQKRYPKENEEYQREKGYYRWRRKDVNDRIRANPDTDEFIYKNKKGEVMKTVYKENPKSMEDVVTYPKDTQSYEHPNEAMAIEIEENIF